MVQNMNENRMVHEDDRTFIMRTENKQLKMYFFKKDDGRVFLSIGTVNWILNN